MRDREVGELWRKGISSHVHRPCLQERNALIRKLVEERTGLYAEAHLCNNQAECQHTNEALDDFGIDPATWATKP